MDKTTLLLYEFSQGEQVQLTTMLGFLPEIQVIAVPRSGHSMALEELLRGTKPPALGYGTPLERKLLVIANARGQMLNMLLSAVGQVTKGQNILRAMLTDTNRTWTGTELCQHLIQEEAELKKYMK